jgi:hypothetical protein
MAAQTMAHNGTPAKRQFLPEGEGVGPRTKGQQKCTDREQFFFLQNFANSSKFFNFYFLL